MYEPPVYVLLQPNHSSAPASFAHPVIEYHFTDDPATILLPSSEHESVLVVDYTSRDVAPAVQSLHPGIAISGLKIVDAPGVSAPPPDAKVPNDKIYIIETVSSIDGASKDHQLIDSQLEMDNPHHTLAQFKDRNTILRRVLDQTVVRGTKASRNGNNN